MRSILNEESFADLFAGAAKAALDKADQNSQTGKNSYIGGSISKYTKGLL